MNNFLSRNRVLHKTSNLAISLVVLPRTTKKCTKMYNALAGPLFFSLNPYTSNSLIAVAIRALPLGVYKTKTEDRRPKTKNRRPTDFYVLESNKSF